VADLAWAITPDGRIIDANTGATWDQAAQPSGTWRDWGGYVPGTEKDPFIVSREGRDYIAYEAGGGAGPSTDAFPLVDIGESMVQKNVLYPIQMHVADNAFLAAPPSGAPAVAAQPSSPTNVGAAPSTGVGLRPALAALASAVGWPTPDEFVTGTIGDIRFVGAGPLVSEITGIRIGDLPRIIFGGRYT
jgi:hypothetical protein